MCVGSAIHDHTPYDDDDDDNNDDDDGHDNKDDDDDDNNAHTKVYWSVGSYDR
jgi:hypothetical protein